MDISVCKKSHDNQHVYKKTVAHLGSTCIYCGEPEEVLNEIPGNEKVKTLHAPKCPGKPPLDELGIMVLTGAFEMYGRIMAIQARIDGMNVANLVHHLNGHYPEYKQVDFIKAADNIMLCVKELQLMKTVNVIK